MDREPDESDAVVAHDDPDAPKVSADPDEDDSMMQDPESSEGEPPGGRAAERLREHLDERFGEDAPPVPPDEQDDTDGDVASDVTGEPEDSNP